MTDLLPTSHFHDAAGLVRPKDAAYDALRRAWNLAADQRPAAIAVATSPAQVQLAIRRAQDRGLRVAAQATGHHAHALPALDDTLLLRTALHDRVRLDRTGRRAHVRAGARWEHLVGAAGPAHLGASHGTAPGAGVVGDVLAGGLGVYGRRHGLAANHVRAIDVVTADGRLRTVDAEHDPDLFWALRGGGGSFGVVCGIDFGLITLGAMRAGTLAWPAWRAPEVLRGWVAWCRTAPEHVTTALRLLRLPHELQVPQPLRGVAAVAVDGVVCEHADDADALLDPLRAIAPPALDTWRPAGACDVLRRLGEPRAPTPWLVGHLLLEDLDDAAIDTLIAAGAARDRDAPAISIELRQLGGALARTPDGGGARSRLEGAFALVATGVPASPADEAAVDARLREVVDALRPWSTGTAYLGFAERGTPAETGYAPADGERLRRIRAEWDPDGLFVAAGALP